MAFECGKLEFVCKNRNDTDYQLGKEGNDAYGEPIFNNYIDEYYNLIIKDQRLELILHDTFMEMYLNAEIILDRITQAIIECKDTDFSKEFDNGEPYYEISNYFRENPEELINYFNDFCNVFKPEFYVNRFGLDNVDELKHMIENIEFLPQDYIGSCRNYEYTIELTDSEELYMYLEGEAPEFVIANIEKNREHLELSPYIKFEMNEHMELEKMIIEW